MVQTQLPQINLFDVLPDIPTGETTGYCQHSFAAPNFYDWQDYVASPALRALGYEVYTPWMTGDHDSFGPLERHVKVRKDKIISTVYYG